MKYSLVFGALVMAMVDVSALPNDATNTTTPTSKVNEFHPLKNPGATVSHGQPFAQRLAWLFAFDDCIQAKCSCCMTPSANNTCNDNCAVWASYEGLPNQPDMPTSSNCSTCPTCPAARPPNRINL
ncbi:hypothetical protein MVLG_04105 [Microbotryum lychnidis-dioicae p1A1 Lamole]|uniref:4Fe-4S ferredoxin-type domain-containing protein n=2 Tax=Microbotryum TaxID=34416 RepID=U5HA71_USTV1|nr:hypothetical protein MVLG_04105 [Microbotryum lychnidis-dioicae p1A1 Lamole]SGZ27585.1 BQ5605_C026g10134 [Microbotryum silenes-dioicae]|eukprot:KDE05512.1 hypothetical protein MVLG_04105 [Microbotryum lychnidis-dioicae p1A1 Lamole]